MLEIPVKLKKIRDESYSILVEPGLLDRAPEMLAGSHSGRSLVVITDDNVRTLYAGRLERGLRSRGLRPAGVVSFPAGEQSKNRRVKERIEDRMFELGLGRDTTVLALGGGVVGDMAGFVAATFNRGVPFVQIPTSLLAMVDSSIGGKTGLDVPWGKNLIGAFHQPEAVIIDPAVLDTLDKREFRSGMAEVVKHGIIADSDLFGFIEDNLDRIMSGDREVVSELVARNCAMKAAVVERDERESNLRQILNFGHTLGHAVESFSGYGWLHGEAVACGMAAEAEIALRLGLLEKADVERISVLLERIGLPVELASLKAPAARLAELTALDKKARGGRARYALPGSIGSMARGADGSYGLEVEPGVVLEALAARGAEG